MILSSPCSAGTIFLRFIVTARRENNTFAVLSSPLGAETIFLPIYRRRAARKQYFCRFIVTARRGNNICAGLSSPLGAGTILFRFSACSVTTSSKIFISTFAEWRFVLEWWGRCLRARPNVRIAAFPYVIDTFSNRKMEALSSVLRTLLVFDERTNKVTRQILCISTQTNIISSATTVNSRMLVVFL